MVSAIKELIEHIGERDVELVRIVFGSSYRSQPQNIIEGKLSDVLTKLDFEYDDGFGGQELFGFIWYTDGTWSERSEFDGSEWWAHMTRPPLDVVIDT